MAQKSLNQVMLIGNITHDPEMRMTPTGVAVCTIKLATNRSYATQSGEQREETEFHRLIAWKKLAELCSTYVHKGSRIYVQGRLTSRKFVGKDGIEKIMTEIIMEDMILLDKKELPNEKS